MFADIRSFTSISERLTSKQTFDFINNYLKGAGPIIRKHGGFIDKYMGDGIMALFETPEAAVGASVQLQNRNARISKILDEKITVPLKVGIGLHTGRLMLGTIGEHQRMDGTVISDAVNLASRVEALTKQYGAEILATEITLQSLLANPKGMALEFRFMDRIAVKGKQRPTIVYEIIRPSMLEVNVFPEILKVWKDSIDLYYDRKFQKAALGFEAILAKNPNDKPAMLFLTRCRGFIDEPPSAEWSGVAIATSK